MKKHFKLSLLIQIDILIVACVIIIGAVTFFSQYRISVNDRQNAVKTFVTEVAEEMNAAVKEYPAYKWLLRYWYENADKLDIEYDVDYRTGVRTPRKIRRFMLRHPDILLKYATAEQIESLPAEDQKMYAEIVYSWLLTRINQIKQSFDISFLYYVVTDSDASEHPYETQFFLLSGADHGSVRGRRHNQVYTLGTVVDITGAEDLQNAMRDAVELARREGKHGNKKPTLDESGEYVDVYVFLDWIDVHPVLTGMSFNIKQMQKEVRTQMLFGSLYAMIYQFLLLQAVMLFLFAFVIRPLTRVLQNIRLYKETKDGAQVRDNLSSVISGREAAIIRHNEIGQLVEDFTELTEEIDDHVKRIETITSEKERIEVELQLASEIQTQMLPASKPEFPGHADLGLYAMTQPAREVGGDFYDYYLIDDDHLALVIADVSGKGVPASLFMVITKTLIKNRAQMGESPGEILYHVNNQLCDENEKDFFVTVWMAIIDLRTGKGIAANAGHEHPVLCRAGGSFELVKYKHNLAIAMLRDISFKENEFELYPGDRIFVYTDGVPESMNPDKIMFGTDRMVEVLNRDPDAVEEELVGNLLGEINNYCDGSEQFDDITMLCFRYKENGKET